MAAEIVEFPHTAPPATPLAQYIRLGELSHRQHASLFSEGHLKAKRIVIDASRAGFLKGEIKQFKEAGVELVLDTKAAELASLQKFKSTGKHIPWAKLAGDSPLGKPYFMAGHPGDIYGQIARFALEFGFDAVLAPGHFLQPDHWETWLNIDRNACAALRHALDREGGKHIAIDYLLIVPHVMLNDTDQRLHLIAALTDLPFDNLWIRASGFGNDSTAQPIAALVTALMQLHNLGRPIINDCLGGLVGEAIMALGASSGIAHGVGELERFSARSWDKPPKERDPDKPGGGRTTRVPIGVLNKALTIKELEVMLSAKGAKRLFSPDAAMTGIRTPAEMIEDPKALAIKESVGQFNALAAVPNKHRAEDFMSRRVEPTVERSRQIKNLIPSPTIAKEKNVDLEKLTTRMSDHHKKLSRLSNMFGELKEQRHELGPAARSVQRLAPVEQRKQNRGQS